MAVNHKSRLIGAILQFSLACILYTVYAVVTINERTAGGMFPGVQLFYAPVIYLANQRFLTRQRTLRAVVILNGAMAAALFAVILVADGIPEFNATIIIVAFVLWLTVCGARLATKEPGVHSLVLMLDASAVMLVLFVGVISAIGVPLSMALAIVAGFSACVVGMIIVRMGGTVGTKEWLVIGAVFCVLLLAVWVLVTWVAAPAGQGIVALWNVAVAAVKAAAGVIWSVVLFLTSLIGPQEPGEYQPYEPDEILTDNLPVVESNPLAGVIFGTIGIILLVLFVVWGVRLLGRLRVGGKTVPQTKKGQNRQRISFAGSLRRLWMDLRTLLRVRLYLTRNRNLPIGVYYGLVNKCSMGPWRKREGETPEEFLRRLSMYAKGDGDLSKALEELIPQVNAVFYAKAAPGGSVKNAGLIRRRIGAAVRGQFLRSLAESRSVRGKRLTKSENCAKVGTMRG